MHNLYFSSAVDAALCHICWCSIMSYLFLCGHSFNEHNKLRKLWLTECYRTESTVFTLFQVVDLLIAMANSASCSSRADLILDPYPSVVDPDDADVLALCPQVQMYAILLHVGTYMYSTCTIICILGTYIVHVHVHTHILLYGYYM